MDILEEIFSEKNEKSKDISKKDIEKFKKISLNLFKNENYPIEKFNEFFNEKISKKAQTNMNLLDKKNTIFLTLNDVQDKLKEDNEKDKKKAGLFGFNWNKDKNKEKKPEVKVDVKNFDIKEFRKEFNLNEEEFSDDFLKQKYIECKGNKKLIFYQIVGIDKLK